MAEAVTLLVFASMLLGCVATDVSVLYALFGGLICFSIYTLSQNFTVFQLGSMLWKGVKDSRTILVVFVLIGFLTAVWRAAGTIPCIVYYSASSMAPKYYLALTFLLCCGMSALTGTSFGTASTMGVVCAGIGRALDIPPVYIGGAVMSGIYFGEQCSPMSSSALLVCKLTGTNIYRLIVRVFARIWIPLLVTLGVYLYLGRGWDSIAAEVESTKIFADAFRLEWITLLPAGVIIVFSLLKIRIEVTMLASIAVAVILCVAFQGIAPVQLLDIMIFGYRVKDAQLSVLINGGGLLSMADIGGIVAISSAYFGIFSSTNLLVKLKQWVLKLSSRSDVFFATIVVSVLTCAVSCNQTLATMLTCEMTKTLEEEKEKLAVNLETSVIVISGLIPWSIACAFPLSVVGAPKESVLYGMYLYLVPLWMLIRSLHKGRRFR